MMRAYYNEIDPAAVAVLKELVARDVIAPGDVDSRSIKDVTANDLRGYTQCHFFAGFADTNQLEFSGQSSARQQSITQFNALPLRNGSRWADAEWIVSPLDGKARRAKSGLSFLVDGFPGRVDLWRVGGNAISPILAAEVIAAFLEAESGLLNGGSAA
jgi:hypothetical protein